MFVIVKTSGVRIPFDGRIARIEAHDGWWRIIVVQETIEGSRPHFSYISSPHIDHIEVDQSPI